MRQTISICLAISLASADCAAVVFDPRDPASKNQTFDRDIGTGHRRAEQATGSVGDPGGSPPYNPRSVSRIMKTPYELGGKDFTEVFVVETRIFGRDESGLHGALVLGNKMTHTRFLGPMAADDQWFLFNDWPYILTKKGRILTIPDSPDALTGRVIPALARTIFHRPFAIAIFGGSAVLPAVAGVFGGGLATGMHHLNFLWSYLGSMFLIGGGILTFQLFRREGKGNSLNRNFLTEKIISGVAKLTPLDNGDYEVTHKGGVDLFSNLIGVSKRRRTLQSCADWLSAVMSRR